MTARQHVLNLGGALERVAQPALTTEALAEALAAQLLVEPPKPLGINGGALLALLEQHFKQQRHLVVIDNLETVTDLQTLMPTLRR